MNNPIDNSHHQALAAFVAELAAMGVDVDEAAKRAVDGLKAGKLYAFRGGDRAALGAEALIETVGAYKYTLTV